MPEPLHRTHHSGAAPIGSGASDEAVNDASGAGSSSGPAGTAPTGQGRAARRRQLARWKKHRRRAVAATAFAIAGGALTVALLPNKPSGGHTYAAAAPDPENAAAPRTPVTDAPSEQPESRASRHTGTRPPVTTSGHQRTTAATPTTATTSPQPKSGPTTQPPGSPHATHTPAKKAHVDSADAAAPESTAPASTERSDTDASPASNEPTPAAEPTTPTHVCLLGVVCIG
ncbi:hypothetical protein AB0I10_18050 [Streptomyces sp. NPDC050636]|uniref:hypothetical protein n=1 Tax=Streptomyces sp. NPDC050636 TaxID=3154510 RepID=UPI00341D15A2